LATTHVIANDIPDTYLERLAVVEEHLGAKGALDGHLVLEALAERRLEGQESLGDDGVALARTIQPAVGQWPGAALPVPVPIPMRLGHGGCAPGPAPAAAAASAGC